MVDISDIDPKELGLKITMSSAEIESIDYMNGFMETIVTAKVTSKKKHPDADKLSLCEIDTGSEQFKVVCGAPNHKEGDIVALALVGTRFTEEFVIKKSKIRGEESSGMLCSAKEMGLSEDHSGIMILPPDTPLGKPMSEFYPDWMDVRFEIDNKSITHRPDLWSHHGFAREIGALYDRPVKDPVNWDLEKTFSSNDELSVTINNSEHCPRYSGLVVKNISIGESPEWLKAMVTSIGMRPISNIVDVTNYVMAEIGEPMHAFDRKKLRGTEIIVRMAEKGEKLVTLDETAHELTEEDIVIADREGPIALAGVMGGGNSEIEDTTSEIVLEAANFNPVTIRKTAHRFNNRTEAAIRFEKSISPELTRAALIRCYDLIKQCCPEAAAETPIIDAYPEKLASITIETTTEYIRRNLGEDLSDEKIISILTALDFDIKDDKGSLTIGVPHYRSTKDVSIPADIVEEVGRIYGYDNITPLPPMVPCTPPAQNKKRLLERKVKEILSFNFNMTEVSGYSFIGEDMLNKLKINEDKELRLRNPLSIEQDRLNRSLIPNLVQNVEFNQRYHDTFGIYEVGRVYLKKDRTSPDLITENSRITGAVFAKKADEPQFYGAKKVARGLIEKLRLAKVDFRPAKDNLPPYAHPARALSVIIDKKNAGLIFELHPRVYKDFDISGSAAIFDLDLDILLDAKKKTIKFNELQKYPDVPFELSVVADSGIYSNTIAKIIANSNQKLISSIDVVDIYQGEQLEAGKKSISFRVIMNAKDRTLEPDEIDAMQKKIIEDLKKKNYSLR